MIRGLLMEQQAFFSFKHHRMALKKISKERHHLLLNKLSCFPHDHPDTRGLEKSLKQYFQSYQDLLSALEATSALYEEAAGKISRLRIKTAVSLQG